MGDQLIEVARLLVGPRAEEAGLVVELRQSLQAGELLAEVPPAGDRLEGDRPAAEGRQV